MLLLEEINPDDVATDTDTPPPSAPPALITDTATSGTRGPSGRGAPALVEARATPAALTVARTITSLARPRRQAAPAAVQPTDHQWSSSSAVVPLQHVGGHDAAGHIRPVVLRGGRTDHRRRSRPCRNRRHRSRRHTTTSPLWVCCPSKLRLRAADLLHAITAAATMDSHARGLIIHVVPHQQL